MDALFGLLIFSLVLILAGLSWTLFLKRSIVFEYERGVVYRQGRFHRILQPGGHWTYPFFENVQKVDIRARFITIPGQEVLSSDNFGVKVSVAVNFRVEDPCKALNSSYNYAESLYTIIQLELRALFGSTPVHELLAKRRQIGEALFEKSKGKAEELGLALLSADIKDIMFPGDLKHIFAQIVNARNEGLAALERARGESAALRNLANAAKMLENNPALLYLRTLQAIESKAGNTIVLSLPQEVTGILPVAKKK